MVFDEVDAGIGGEAAVAVGRALSELAEGRQVIVVTHLAQVAAFADAQILVEKSQGDGAATTTARVLEGEDRVVELSRMLSGSPDSDVAHRHAQELLATGGRRAARARAPMTLLAGLVLGAAAAFAIWVGMQPVFARPVFSRQNYRGVTLPTAVGLVIPLAVVATSAALTLLDHARLAPGSPGSGSARPDRHRDARVRPARCARRRGGRPGGVRLPGSRRGVGPRSSHRRLAQDGRRTGGGDHRRGARVERLGGPAAGATARSWRCRRTWRTCSTGHPAGWPRCRC